MGLGTRIGKVAAATYAAPSTSAAAIVVTWSSNTPTPGTTQTIANGSSVTDAETGQWIANMEAQLTAIVADIAAIKAALALAAADSAAMLLQLNAGE